jgi:hypothetical protein
MITFSPPLSIVTREQFNEHCKTVFFRTEEYPTSTAVITHGVLWDVIREFRWSEKDPAALQQYVELGQICRINLEISIANLDLLLPASLENAQALLIAVSVPDVFGSFELY